MTHIIKGEICYKRDFGKMILISAPYFIRLFGNNINAVLENLYIKKHNLFSYKHTLFALKDKAIASLILSYSYHTKRKENFKTGWLLIKQLKFNLIRNIPVLMRFHKTIGTIKKGDYYISNVATYESFRKQGMAKTLLMKCEEYCRKEKMSGMVLDVEKHNKGAIHLYENLGYKQTDEYNIKFGDTNLMFLRMKKPVK